MKHYIWLAGLFVTLVVHQAALAVGPRYSILQGATSDKVTHFTVVARKGEALTFRAVNIEKEKLKFPTTVEIREMAGSDHVVHRIRFDGMEKDLDYILEVEDENGELMDERNFKMLDPASQTGRIAITSCMLRQFHNPFMWNQLTKPENKPDLMLILGDVVYLDRAFLLRKRNPTTELEVWTSFVKARERLKFYKWKDLVPVLSVWDDHDSGGDNVDYKHELMAKIRPIYETFMANDEIAGVVERGPALAKNFRLYGKNFIMLDGRSFRGYDEFNPMLGALQERWMMERIRTGANFILNGTQFYGEHLQKDSMEYNWPEQTVEFSKRLKTKGEEIGATFAFLTGDIHFSEVQRLEPWILGYETVEITSSSAHSSTFPGRHLLRRKNPRQENVTSTHNVVLLDFENSIRPFEFTVRSIGWRGQKLFDQNIVIDNDCLAKVVNAK